MAEVLEQIDELVKEAEQELAAVNNLAGLEQFRIKFLGTNGKVKDLMNLFKEVPKEQKPA